MLLNMVQASDFFLLQLARKRVSGGWRLRKLRLTHGGAGLLSNVSPDFLLLAGGHYPDDVWASRSSFPPTLLMRGRQPRQCEHDLDIVMTSANARVCPSSRPLLSPLLPTSPLCPRQPPHHSRNVWHGDPISPVNVNVRSPHCAHERRASWYIVRKHYWKCELLQNK